jgi:hypothetical protein
MKSAVSGMVAAAIVATSTAMVYPPPSESIVIQMSRAINLTKKANINPSVASDACALWASILTKQNNIPLPQDAMAAAHALYASALTRIGRDKDAIVEYQHSLQYLEQFQTTVTETEIDVRMGLGKSLQRLLRYRKAKNIFADIACKCAGFGTLRQNHSEAVQRAVLCCLRLGDARSALKIINEFESVTANRTKDPEITGLKGVVSLQQSTSESDLNNARSLLLYAADNCDTILYKWLYIATRRKPKPSDFSLNQMNDGQGIQKFAEINNSAFDDPFLVYLDDKLLLHRVLTSFPEAQQFYPQSFVIPRELSQFQDACKNRDDNWMLKDRSGYGSHGNRVVSASVIKYSSSSESALCQQLIQPAMLLRGRKFSLRIYAIYFPKGKDLTREEERLEEVYISTNGLVKLASAEMDSNNPLDDQYMTNSGRGDGRSAMQYDLNYLRSELKKDNIIKYDSLWGEIEDAARLVMSKYIALRSEHFHLSSIKFECDDETDTPSICEHECLSCVPKILGFDFMLDASGQPWLLEVNRFPGLEPRSSMDSTVKANVLYDAWCTAASSLGLDVEVMDAIRPQGYKSYALVKLQTTY